MLQLLHTVTWLTFVVGEDCVWFEPELVVLGLVHHRRVRWWGGAHLHQSELRGDVDVLGRERQLRIPLGSCNKDYSELPIYNQDP